MRGSQSAFLLFCALPALCRAAIIPPKEKNDALISFDVTEDQEGAYNVNDFDEPIKYEGPKKKTKSRTARGVHNYQNYLNEITAASEEPNIDGTPVTVFSILGLPIATGLEPEEHTVESVTMSISGDLLGSEDLVGAGENENKIGSPGRVTETYDFPFTDVSLSYSSMLGHDSENSDEIKETPSHHGYTHGSSSNPTYTEPYKPLTDVHVYHGVESTTDHGGEELGTQSTVTTERMVTSIDEDSNPASGGDEVINDGSPTMDPWKGITNVMASLGTDFSDATTDAMSPTAMVGGNTNGESLTTETVIDISSTFDPWRDVTNVMASLGSDHTTSMSESTSGALFHSSVIPEGTVPPVSITTGSEDYPTMPEENDQTNEVSATTTESVVDENQATTEQAAISTSTDSMYESSTVEDMPENQNVSTTTENSVVLEDVENHHPSTEGSPNTPGSMELEPETSTENEDHLADSTTIEPVLTTTTDTDGHTMPAEETESSLTGEVTESISFSTSSSDAPMETGAGSTLDFLTTNQLFEVGKQTSTTESILNSETTPKSIMDVLAQLTTPRSTSVAENDKSILPESHAMDADVSSAFNSSFNNIIYYTAESLNSFKRIVHCTFGLDKLLPSRQKRMAARRGVAVRIANVENIIISLPKHGNALGQIGVAIPIKLMESALDDKSCDEESSAMKDRFIGNVQISLVQVLRLLHNVDDHIVDRNKALFGFPDTGRPDYNFGSVKILIAEGSDLLAQIDPQMNKIILKPGMITMSLGDDLASPEFLVRSETTLVALRDLQKTFQNAISFIMIRNSHIQPALATNTSPLKESPVLTTTMSSHKIETTENNEIPGSETTASSTSEATTAEVDSPAGDLQNKNDGIPVKETINELAHKLKKDPVYTAEDIKKLVSVLEALQKQSESQVVDGVQVVKDKETGSSAPNAQSDEKDVNGTSAAKQKIKDRFQKIREKSKVPQFSSDKEDEPEVTVIGSNKEPTVPTTDADLPESDVMIPATAVHLGSTSTATSGTYSATEDAFPTNEDVVSGITSQQTAQSQESILKNKAAAQYLADKAEQSNPEIAQNVAAAQQTLHLVPVSNEEQQHSVEPHITQSTAMQQQSAISSTANHHGAGQLLVNQNVNTQGGAPEVNQQVIQNIAPSTAQSAVAAVQPSHQRPVSLVTVRLSPLQIALNMLRNSFRTTFSGR